MLRHDNHEESIIKDKDKKKPREANVLDETKALLHHLGLHPRKGLGQHFLIREEILDIIVDAAELTKSDVVMEVGPGLGILTRELAKRAGYVIAIELDDNLAKMLQENLASFPNVTVINKNILDVDPLALMNEYKSNFPATVTRPMDYKVVANLPYYITSPVLRHFLETTLRPNTVVVMVQKEVAEAIIAGPGESARSVLSLSIQVYAKPRIVGYVPPRSFYPPPAVESAVIKLEMLPEPLVKWSDEESFFRLVSNGFCSPRKQLVNSLMRGLCWPRERVLALLEKSGIEQRRRAETLSLEEWLGLWRVYVLEK